MKARPVSVTELHLHLEGSLFPRSAIEIAAGLGHPWGQETEASLRRRFRFGTFDAFLETIREMCTVLCSTGALRRTARELSHFLRIHGVRYAEVYVSPYIYMRVGMSYAEIIEAVVTGFDEAQDQGGAICRILLDSVRHWGPSAATAVLDGAQAYPHDSVIGFGLGGSETPALEEFAEHFARAASLGLRRLVHAGETSSGDDVWKAVEILGAERIAHGIRALESEPAMGALRKSGVPLDLAVTSNYRTGVVTGEHPIRRLVDQQLIVTLSTDDPSLFRTDPIREYERARRFGHLTREELFVIARNGIDVCFASESIKKDLRRELDSRRSRVEDDAPC